MNIEELKEKTQRRIEINNIMGIVSKQDETTLKLIELNERLQKALLKASEDLGKMIDNINSKIIIGLHQFCPELERIQDELVGVLDND